ncbi:hypothetical protein INT45_002743 [Circinella minor]|uniref:Uncharacterized protein n=1 Tax=Circinella minor TaxID=1195481 RepID=A0A8H7VIF2_9FUNG|nr:hypothetical protein INT45_002743 [Circinella minor]
MGDFVKYTKDYIHHKLQRAETHQDILTINSTKKQQTLLFDALENNALETLKQDVARSVHSTEEASSFIVDLGKSAVIDLPNLVTIKRSKHATDLRKMFENDHQISRYTIRMLRTNGVCLQAVMTDWAHPRRKLQHRQFKYLPEIRKFAFRKCEELGQHDSNLLDEYEGVFGINLGETWTAGAFYLPTDTEHQPGVQHTIRRDELYGREPINRKWLENRNEQTSVHNIQRDLAKSGGSKTSNVDTKMSMRSEIDKACERIINMADASRQRAIEEGALSELSTRKNKFLIGMGLDRMDTGNRKGAKSGLAQQFADKLYDHAKARQEPVQIDLSRIDEYCSSKLCCHCFMEGEIMYVEYLRRSPAPSRQFYKDNLDNQGKEKVIRILVCENCHKKFHRDRSAGSVQASIATSSILEHGQRPQAVIRKSRRINSQ